MKKPSLKEFDITANQYAKYQAYKSKIEDRKKGREEFENRFNKTLISIITIVFLLLILFIAKTVLLSTIFSMLSNKKLGSVLLFILAALIVLMALFFLTRLAIGKLLKPKLHALKIYRPIKKLYFKLQSPIYREPYFNNASKYELQNKAYYNYIGDLQQRFPDIIEFNYNLQKYLRNIIDEIISHEHIAINNSIINQQLEKRRTRWLKMDGITFEHEVANIYKKHGYDAKTTKATGEGGVDIRLWKEDEYSIVQCKNVCSQIDEPAVKKLVKTMKNEKAYKAILICSGGFTPKARLFAKDKLIELLDLNQFLKLVNDIYPQKYELIDAILDASVNNSKTTYTFKVIGKAGILFSSYSQSNELNYCLFETPKEAKNTIRRLQHIDEMPPSLSHSYDIKEWWLESIPADYCRKVLYYIKVSEKEKESSDNKEHKLNSKYMQKKLWDTEKYVQKNMWDEE